MNQPRPERIRIELGSATLHPVKVVKASSPPAPTIPHPVVGPDLQPQAAPTVSLNLTMYKVEYGLQCLLLRSASCYEASSSQHWGRSLVLTGVPNSRHTVKRVLYRSQLVHASNVRCLSQLEPVAYWGFNFIRYGSQKIRSHRRDAQCRKKKQHTSASWLRRLEAYRRSSRAPAWQGPLLLWSNHHPCACRIRCSFPVRCIIPYL